MVKVSDINLIFLISLPRSGSTLLQRMLATSPEIHTVSEPWLLLPLSTMVENKYTIAMYNHQIAYDAISDFIQSLPDKRKGFYKEVEKFILSLYSKSSRKGSLKYFLDKTPRYYLIIDFLSDVFPSAKFIFLFRNPLEVMASILSSWMNNKFFLYRYYIDLFHGPQALVNGYEKLRERAIQVNYSDLVKLPHTELKKICSFLNIQYDRSMTDKFTSVKLNGRMGDKKGVGEYNNITTASLEKWKKVLNTNYRKMYAKRYIRNLGDKTLSVFGTNKKDILGEIASIQNDKGGSLVDFYYHSTSVIKRWILIDYYKKLVKFGKNNRKFYPYL